MSQTAIGLDEKVKARLDRLKAVKSTSYPEFVGAVIDSVVKAFGSEEKARKALLEYVAAHSHVGR